jgi:amino acid permease
MTKANVYLNSFIAINTVIIFAVLLTLIVPKWIFQNGIDNAPTFVNGMTTSIGIAVAFES